MNSFLRIEMFINFQINDNLYQAHQCGYCGDNSGRVSPENKKSQREHPVNEQKNDNQADIVSFGADESHGNGRIAADDCRYPGKSRNKKVKLRMMNMKTGRNHAKYGDTSNPK